MKPNPTRQVAGGHLRAILVVLIGALAIAPSAHAFPRVKMVKDVNPTDESLMGIGKRLFFVASGGGHGNELWKSDGTPAGTKMVKNIHPDDCGEFGGGSDPGGFTNVDGTLFFGATDCKHGAEIWRSDGTRSGTRRLTRIPNGNGESPGNLTNVDGRLFFSRSEYVADPPRLWFRSELWKSDGTRSGTKLVYRSFWSQEHFVGGFRNLNGTLLFTANARYRGHELWKSDGTRAGTRVVKDINSGRGSSYPSSFRRLGRRLFFAADDGIHGSELWKSDGTRHGTKLVKDINRSYGGRGISRPEFLTNVDGRLFFSAYRSDTGRELWKSDGTRARTKLVRDIYPGDISSGSDPRSLANIGGKLFFEAEDPTHGRELWKSDGTRAGTKLVKDIDPGVDGFASEPTHFDGGVLFGAGEPSHGGELWWSDGTRAGTRMVEDINPGTNSSYPRWLAKAGHAVFFEANDGTHGSALWKAVP